MKTNPFLTTSLLLVTILAFVYFAQPIYAKANSVSLDYVETSLSTQEVGELIAGVDDVALGLILGILGFIVITYMTLRSVHLPIEGLDQMSFIDKCKSIGQFVLDNADDTIKNVIYSVYLFSQDHPAATVFTIGPFVLMSLPSFFGALSLWLGGSFLINPSENLENVLSIFGGTITFYNSLTYTYHDEFESAFNTYSSISYSLTFGSFQKNIYTSPEYWRYMCYSFESFPDVLLIYSDTNSVNFYGYTYSDALTLSRQNFTYYSADVKYANDGFSASYDPNHLPTKLTSVSWSSLRTANQLLLSGPYAGFDLVNLKSLLELVGATCKIGQISSANPSNVSVNDVTWVTDPPTTSEWSDQIYNPTAGTLPIDIVGTWEDIRDALTDLSTSTLSIGELINIIAKNQTLALDSAVDTTNVVQGNSYNFPSLDGVWKYPQYFFDMLKGWGHFVGGCLNAVTVGEGGLSWIFYGGFVLLICGGVIGKILLG